MSIEENKMLCERYPYLIPRSKVTDKVSNSYDYSYIIGDELPKGWRRLFLQMCEDIRQPLIDANYLDDFRFMQVKEKYGTMRCYSAAPTLVHQIIGKYEDISRYVCEECGAPATRITDGWIESLCEECCKKKIKPEHLDGIERIEFKPQFTYLCYENGERIEVTVDYSDEWRRFYE